MKFLLGFCFILTFSSQGALDQGTGVDISPFENPLPFPAIAPAQSAHSGDLSLITQLDPSTGNIEIQGTAFLWKPGIYLTAQHVIESLEQDNSFLFSHRKNSFIPFEITEVQFVQNRDIAVLKTNLPPSSDGMALPLPSETDELQVLCWGRIDSQLVPYFITQRSWEEDKLNNCITITNGNHALSDVGPGTSGSPVFVTPETTATGVVTSRIFSTSTQQTESLLIQRFTPDEIDAAIPSTPLLSEILTSDETIEVRLRHPTNKQPPHRWVTHLLVRVDENSDSLTIAPLNRETLDKVMIRFRPLAASERSIVHFATIQAGFQLEAPPTGYYVLTLDIPNKSDGEVKQIPPTVRLHLLKAE